VSHSKQVQEQHGSSRQLASPSKQGLKLLLGGARCDWSSPADDDDAAKIVHSMMRIANVL
jgi:hypothetical protein